MPGATWEEPSLRAGGRSLQGAGQRPVWGKPGVGEGAHQGLEEGEVGQAMDVCPPSLRHPVLPLEAEVGQRGTLWERPEQVQKPSARLPHSHGEPTATPPPPPTSCRRKPQR